MTEAPRIVALVLAAGSSSRMGGFKPLAVLGSSTFLEEAVARFHRAGVGDVRVVIGHRSHELAPVIERLGARWVFNARHEQGMFSSILTGARGFEADVEAFFVLPVDIPLVKPRTIQALLSAYSPQDPHILYPCFDGKRGHPPLIPRSYLDEDPPPDYPGGLRGLLARFDHNALDVDVADENILLDCDTPSDYRTILERWAQEPMPSETNAMPSAPRSDSPNG